MEWQDIETAPDNEAVDLWVCREGPHADSRAYGYREPHVFKIDGVWQGENGERIEGEWRGISYRATHWIPIPQPPLT